MRASLQALLKKGKPDALIVGSFIYFTEGFAVLKEYAENLANGFGLAGIDAPDLISLRRIMAGDQNQPFSCLVYAQQQAEAMGEAAATRLLQMIKQAPGDPLHLRLVPPLKI